MELRGACIFGQSGGPTSVINASAYGVFKAALESGSITRVLGAAHGIKGVLNDRLYDISKEDLKELELLKSTPSSALGSCRYKLKDASVDETTGTMKKRAFQTSSGSASSVGTPRRKRVITLILAVNSLGQALMVHS